MNWKEYIRSNIEKSDNSIRFDFSLPVTDKLLIDLKQQLNLNDLPKELEELYSQTDGIDEKLNGEKIGELIWKIERVIETNKEYRCHPDFKELYMSFEQLVFFSDAGNGDLFGFTTLNGRFNRFDIFVWNHENDSRNWVAPDLTTFILWWTNSTIKI